MQAVATQDGDHDEENTINKVQFLKVQPLHWSLHGTITGVSIAKKFTHCISQ